MITYGEALMAGIAPIMMILGFIGWLLVWAAADEKQDYDSKPDMDMPKDASWLSQTPEWMTTLMLGICILAFVVVAEQFLKDILLP